MQVAKVICRITLATICVSLFATASVSARAYDPAIEELVRKHEFDAAAAKGKQLFESQENDPLNWLDYAMLLESIGRREEARNIYLEFIQRFPGDQHVAYARGIVAKLEKDLDWFPQEADQKLSADDSYLVQTIIFSTLGKWPKSKMPIKVAVRVDGASQVPQKFLALSRECPAVWQRASNNAVTFKIVEGNTPADLDIVWTSNSNRREVCDRQAGTHVDLQMQTGAINHATIYVLTKSHMSGGLLLDTSARRIVLHEIGHALGLWHSKDPDDIMYYGGMHINLGVLTARDVALINKYYSRDITDLSQLAIDACKKVTSDHDSRLFPQLYLQQGLACNRKHNYKQSIECYKNAINVLLQSNKHRNEDLIFNYFDLGDAYMTMNQYKEAEVNFRKAAELSRAENGQPNLTRIEEFLFYCQIENKQYQDAEKLGQALILRLAKAGQLSDMADQIYVLGTLYHAQEKYPQALASYKQARAVFDKLHINSVNANECRKQCATLKP